MILGVVGNDVVDLADPRIAGHHRRERFVSRVCAAEERGLVATACDLWTLFAAKEAAYKALVKLGCSPGFAHREIVVAADLQTVRWRGHRLELSVARDEQHVHAVVCSARAGPTFVGVARGEPEGPAARALLRALVAAATGYAARDLEVVREPVAGAWDGFGPPFVEFRGTAIDADVSMSHDGPFVAVAGIIGVGRASTAPSGGQQRPSLLRVP